MAGRRGRPMDSPPAIAMACSHAMLITAIQVVVSWRCNSLHFSASIERDSTALRSTPRRSATERRHRSCMQSSHDFDVADSAWLPLPDTGSHELVALYANAGSNAGSRPPTWLATLLATSTTRRGSVRRCCDRNGPAPLQSAQSGSLVCAYRIFVVEPKQVRSEPQLRSSSSLAAKAAVPGSAAGLGSRLEVLQPSDQ
jgi:hypothetical protein